ncbi:S-layer homology domain-containing protein [Paenibacillus sp. CF384]|uniref:S-layer homology domain-containing protein n=1 Tax=Paenibacillus sp. CF384 TaxID=1884382 RepID=UPI000899D3A2|nr:S-layer homology domain-containing protein [Paenibacillus sp. CF384]SDX81845.1 S-layer homology domain-containing protein [Paenibacillus sp. CF384]
MHRKMLALALVFVLAFVSMNTILRTAEAAQSGNWMTDGGGFESGIAAWEDWGATGVTSNEADVHSGEQAAVIGTGEAIEGGAGWYVADVTGGQKFTISAWGKASEGETAIVGVKSLNGPAIPGSEASLTFSGQAYEQKSITYTAAAGATELLIYIYKNEGAGYAFIDDISVVAETPEIDIVHPHNHAYLPEEWFYLPKPDETIAERVEQLEQHEIEYQFANIGSLQADGTIDPTQSDELGHWIKVSRETDPNQKVIAWINGNTERHLHVGTEEEKVAMHATIVNSLKTMIDTGFLYEGVYYKVDGIQFDIEPLRARWKDDPELLSLLKDIRNAVGNDVHLSIATPAWDSVWSNAYITEIANVMDMLNPMIYDTIGPDSWKPNVVQSGEEYEALWKATSLRYSTAIAASNNPDCQLAPIMPAYDTKGYTETDPTVPEYGQFVVYHDPVIENVYHAARGLKQAIADGANVYGSGIFWWGTFILDHPDPRDNQDYSHARGWWKDEWLTNGVSTDVPQEPEQPEAPEDGSAIVSNGSFESGTSPWEDWGFVEFVKDPAPNAGNKAARIGLEEGGMGQIVTGIGEGKKLTLSGWGKVDIVGDEAMIGIDCLNDKPGAGGGNKIPGGKFTLRFDGTAYEKKSINFTTVPGTTKIQVYLYKSSTAGGYVYVDDIRVELQQDPPAQPPVSGSTSAASAVIVPANAANGGMVQLILPSGAVNHSSTNGSSLTTATIGGMPLEQAFAQAKTDNALSPKVKIQIEAVDGELRTLLPAAALSQISKSTPGATLILIYDGGSYELPLALIDAESLGTKLGVPAVEVSIKLSVTPVTADIDGRLKAAAAAQGIVPLSGAIEFTLVAEASGKTVALNNFGSTYVARGIVLDEKIDASRSTGVLYDPDTNQFTFVPTAFTSREEGVTEAKLSRNGNSVYVVVTSNHAFEDLTGHWARNDIERLAAKLVLNGVGGNRFVPDGQVTRAEFTAMLVRSLGLTGSAIATFSDVQSDAWFAGALGTAANAGLVQGDAAGKLRPDALVTREQMAVMASRALSWLGVQHPAKPLNLEGFGDQEQIAPWALADGQLAISTGLLKGRNDTLLAPKSYASRAEAAALIGRMLVSANFK